MTEELKKIFARKTIINIIDGEGGLMDWLGRHAYLYRRCHPSPSREGCEKCNEVRKFINNIPKEVLVSRT